MRCWGTAMQEELVFICQHLRILEAGSDKAMDCTIEDLILERGKRFFASPKHPEQLYDAPGLLFSGYWGLFSHEYSSWGMNLTIHLHVMPRSLELYLHSPIYLHGMQQENFTFILRHIFSPQMCKHLSLLSGVTLGINKWHIMPCQLIKIKKDTTFPSEECYQTFVALINDNDCMWMIIIRCVIHTGNMAA